MFENQDWTEAYKEMCAVVKPPNNKTGGIPEILHMDLWTEQIDFLPEEFPWPPHSLFFNFNTDAIRTVGKNVQELAMKIDLIYCLDSLAETYNESDTQAIAFEFMATCKKIHSKFQGLSGLNFSSMNRVALRRVPAPQYLKVIAQTYDCIIMDYTGSKQPGEATITSLGINKNAAPGQNINWKLFDTKL